MGRYSYNDEWSSFCDEYHDDFPGGRNLLQQLCSSFATFILWPQEKKRIKCVEALQTVLKNFTIADLENLNVVLIDEVNDRLLRLTYSQDDRLKVEMLKYDN